MIHLSGIHKAYGPRRLLEGVDWHIKPGQRVGLVGPNGAGKSTLIRMITGEVAPDHGEVTFVGGVTVGHLPQEIATLKGRSVREEAREGLRPILELGETLRALEEEMAQPGGRTDAAMSRYADLQATFEMEGGFTVEARVESILAGLGFRTDQFDADCGTLSGGWQMRVALARLLLSNPDVLLLDEPTNHLDLESVEWLEGFLSRFAGSLILISHDRWFLNRICTHIAALSDRILTLYKGDFDAFVAQATLRAEQIERQARNTARKAAQLERFVERFKAKATKAAQARSKQKQLDKLEQVQTTREARTIKLKFPVPERSGRVSLTLTDIRKAYGDHVIYDGLDVQLLRGQKVALVGPNGAGKSTLIKLLAASTGHQRGVREVGHKVRVYYFAQHQVEALDLNRTVLEEALSDSGGLLPTEVRAILGAFLMGANEVEKRVAVLSGGEKNRLALAKMLMKPANVLLLDEPTNHLDMASRQVLEEALVEYPGTVVIISHDRHFIDAVATEVWEIADGRVRPCPGNYLDYQHRKAEGRLPAPLPLHKEQEGGAPSVAPAEASTEAEPAGEGRRKKSREQKQKEAQARQKRFAETKSLRIAVQKAEARAEVLESELEGLRAEQARPEHYQDGEAVKRVAQAVAEAESELETVYAAWEEATSALEAYDAES